MSKKLNISILVVLLVMLFTASLYGELEQRAREKMGEITDNMRTSLRENKSLFFSFPARNRDYQLSELIYQTIDWYTDDWINSEKMDYSYDIDGRVSVVFFNLWDEDEEEWFFLPLFIVFTWNDDNLPVGLAFRLGDIEYGFDFVVINQEFNDNLQIISYTVNMIDDFDELETIFEYNFYYDEDDILETASYFDYDYGEYGRMFFSYDNQQRPVETVSEYSEDGENWYYDLKTLVEYHANDQSVYADYQNILNHQILFSIMYHVVSLSQPMYEYEYYYYWFAERNGWELLERTTLTYYPDDKLETLLIEDYYGDDVWNPSYRELYTYDDLSYPEMITCQYFSGYEEEWIDDERYIIVMAESSNIGDIYPKLKPVSITNYPNPFNPETTIRFDLPVNGLAELSVVNIKGQTVRFLIREYKEAGTHTVIWNGKDDNNNHLPSGIYFYNLKTAGTVTRGKMLLLK